MGRSRIFTLTASIALVLAACGGDDDGGLTVPDAPTDAPTADTPDAPDSGDVDEMLDQVLDEGDLDELMEDLDEFATSTMGGDGGGTITVGDVVYTVDADICFAMPTDFTLDGPATGSDGSSGWVDASYSITTKEDMAEFMDETQLEFLFPAGTDELVDMTVSVNVGQTGRFESVDDQPSWTVFGGDILDLGLELDWEFTGNGLRGSGQATDNNYVALQFDESVPIEFDISCR